MNKQARNTWLFVGFLLLGGVLHSGDIEEIPFLVTVFYCAEYLIYAGLILSWMQSVGRRLSPSREKRFLLAAACLMLLFITAQFVKYRIAVSPGLTRYCWYVYYVPIILIPTLFLMTCFRFLKGVDRRHLEFWFLLPAGLLVLGVLSNDFHMMAFRPKEGILHHQAFLPNTGIRGLIGSPNTYTHGFLYYAAYAWAGCSLAIGIVLLLVACKKSGRWKKALLPALFLLLIPPVMVVSNRTPKDSIPITYEWVEIVIFGMLSVFEACIRSRLIPSNENYPGFFAQMELPAQITDKTLKPIYETRSPIRAAEEQLRASLDDPVLLTPDTRLLGTRLRAGYAFHTEDLSSINRMNEELRDANEVLLEENELLTREQELDAEQTGIRERSRLYQKAAQEVYPTQKKIAGILEKAAPGTESFRPDIEKALALTAYVKRKANFVLVEAERGTISAGELASALEESAHYLGYLGMNTAVDIKAERSFPSREAIAVYDCFEAAAEKLLGKTKELYVALKDGELLMMADCGELPELTGLPLPLRQSVSDRQLILRAALGGETE